jgi:hypothetical protein
MKKFPCDRPFGFRHFAFRWGLPPSDGNRNQQAIATRPPSQRGSPPSDDEPMVARLEPPPRPSQSLWACHPD